MTAAASRALSYLSDGVGGAAIGDLCGLGAEGGDGSDDLGGVDGRILGPGVGTSGNGENGNGGELHLDGLFGVTNMYSKRDIKSRGRE
jgi:hypothetical protein